MIDSKFRQLYQKSFVDPILFFFVKSGVHPNILTLFALVFGIMVIPLIANGFGKMAILFMVFSGYLDTLDGSLARATNKSSNIGAFLDIVADRIVEFSVILGLFLVDPTSRGVLCFLMLGAVLICVTTFLSVAIFQENDSNKGFFYSPGIMERAEAFILFTIMIAFPSTFNFVSILFVFLVCLTGMIRTYEFCKY